MNAPARSARAIDDLATLAAVARIFRQARARRLAAKDDPPPNPPAPDKGKPADEPKGTPAPKGPATPRQPRGPGRHHERD